MCVSPSIPEAIPSAHLRVQALRTTLGLTWLYTPDPLHVNIGTAKQLQACSEASRPGGWSHIKDSKKRLLVAKQAGRADNSLRGLKELILKDPCPYLKPIPLYTNADSDFWRVFLGFNAAKCYKHHRLYKTPTIDYNRANNDHTSLCEWTWKVFEKSSDRAQCWSQMNIDTSVLRENKLYFFNNVNLYSRHMKIQRQCQNIQSLLTY